MIPASFQEPRVLRWLNIGAVGLALAAIVSPSFAAVIEKSPAIAFVIGLPTLVFGALWAALLRWRRTVGKTSIRVGWVASIPLAMLNSVVSSLLVIGVFNAEVSAKDMLTVAGIAATLGAILWVPALLGTLLCFGVPIAWAQRLARRGLAGEERGEWVIGLVCLAMSVFGAVFWADLRMRPDRWAEWMTLGSVLQYAYCLLGAVSGSAAAALAFLREGRRRKFVAQVETGTVPGYRIDSTEEGKVLLRVSAEGKGHYRVTNFEQELFDLTEEGEALQPKQLATPDSPG